MYILTTWWYANTDTVAELADSLYEWCHRCTFWLLDGMQTLTQWLSLQTVCMNDVTDVHSDYLMVCKHWQWLSLQTVCMNDVTDVHSDYLMVCKHWHSGSACRQSVWMMSQMYILTTWWYANTDTVAQLADSLYEWCHRTNQNGGIHIITFKP